tara:strand:- start:4660 stop:4815 length:156 start_codon:yes stop_codon:yes gene_type:complete
MKTTYDKCLICTHVAPSNDFIGGLCPNCGSSDVDDADTDQYEEEDDLELEF